MAVESYTIFPRLRHVPQAASGNPRLVVAVTIGCYCRFARPYTTTLTGLSAASTTQSQRPTYLNYLMRRSYANYLHRAHTTSSLSLRSAGLPPGWPPRLHLFTFGPWERSLVFPFVYISRFGLLVQVQGPFLFSVQAYPLVHEAPGLVCENFL